MRRMTDMTMPNGRPAKLALYHRPSCFYCRSVFQALEELNVPVELRHVGRDRSSLSELVAARGRRTVPVLRIEHGDGRVEWLPESRDIIAYLRQLGHSPDAAPTNALSGEAAGDGPPLASAVCTGDEGASTPELSGSGVPAVTTSVAETISAAIPVVSG